MLVKVKVLLIVCAVILSICASPRRLKSVIAQQQAPSVERRCCGKKPPKFPDTALASYSTFTGQVAVVTGQLVGGASVVVVDLKNQNSGIPVDANWAAPRYTHPDWANTKIGDVFGVTIDDRGDVYVTSTTSYQDNSPATVPKNIYRIDGSTGASNVFATLPNDGPALGNIHYSCAYESFYVSNFADGRIYQLKKPNAAATTGNIVATFDHQTATIVTGAAAATPEGNTDYSKFSPKNSSTTKVGGRVWGLAVLGDRLYYGVWRQDGGSRTGINNVPNEVWSVALTGTGAFQNPAKLEITIPALNVTNPTGANYSNPVSSITFSAGGEMLLAERSMNGDENTPMNAHQSRVLEYSLSSGVWTLQNPLKYQLSVFSPGSPSSAGGADYDSTGPRVWGTADAMHFSGNDTLYGIQGLPMTGGDVHNSLLIDLTSSTTTVDKNQIGDIEIPCPEEKTQESCGIKTNEISCKADGTGGYLFTFTVTNNTGKPVTHVLATPPPNSNFTITPQDVPIPGGILQNGQSTTLQVTINGGTPEQKICFTVTLMTEDGPCCTVEVCTELPNCCAVAKNVSVKCNGDGTYTYVLSVVNTSKDPIEHIYLYPPAGITMTPNYFAVSLAPGATFQSTITIKGARPGSFCFGLSLHTEGMKDCCSGDQCVTLPECHAYTKP